MQLDQHEIPADPKSVGRRAAAAVGDYARKAEIERERAAAAAKPRRSTLSTAQKVTLIGRLGFDRYLKLPL